MAGFIDRHRDHIVGCSVRDLTQPWHEASPQFADSVIGEAHHKPFSDNFLFAGVFYSRFHLNLPPDRKNLYQHDAGDKSADVRGIGDAALAGGRKIAKYELINDPDADGRNRRNGREEIEDDSSNAPLRKQEDISAEYAGDRTGSAEHRNDRTGIHRNLCKSRRESANDIKQRKAEMA